MKTTELQATTGTQLQRIAWLSARDRQKQFDCLMHHFNEASLAACFHTLDGRKAMGVDGVSKADYGEHLEENLKELIQRMRRMGYRPGPVRRVLIPKEDKPGATRPLGISNFEDKLVQVMMHKVLEAIYEPLFLESSYGFRPGRGAHDAIRALHQHLYRHEVESVIDVDLASYFDSIDHKRLLERLREKIKDRRFLRYLARMLKAGVLNEGELTVDEEGVSQGSVCSPILANVYAHYVLDEWFEGTVKRHCEGEVELFRYADDMVICCRYEGDARRIHKALKGRLAKYGLALNGEKTRLVDFSRKSSSGEFSFLGFTFYQGKSRRGHWIPKVKTNGRRLSRKLKRVTTWAKGIRSRERLMKIWNIFCAKVRGHIRYYGVSFNLRAVSKFVYQALRILYKWLNRRSQRRSMTWEQFRLFIQTNPLPRVVVYHTLY